jgi:hypothetical protein
MSQIAYQPFGPIGGLSYGNGIVETRAFDLDYPYCLTGECYRANEHCLTMPAPVASLL